VKQRHLIEAVLRAIAAAGRDAGRTTIGTFAIDLNERWLSPRPRGQH
jgi:hypothetical protein